MSWTFLNRNLACVFTMYIHFLLYLRYWVAFFVWCMTDGMMMMMEDYHHDHHQKNSRKNMYTLLTFISMRFTLVCLCAWSSTHNNIAIHININTLSLTHTGCNNECICVRVEWMCNLFFKENPKILLSNSLVICLCVVSLCVWVLCIMMILMMMWSEAVEWCDCVLIFFIMFYKKTSLLFFCSWKVFFLHLQSSF